MKMMPRWAGSLSKSEAWASMGFRRLPRRSLLPSRWSHRRWRTAPATAWPGFGHQGLAEAGGADEQDVGLLDLNVAHVPLLQQRRPLVVVVYGDGQAALGADLSNHIAIEVIDDFARRGDLVEEPLGLAPPFTFLVKDRTAKVDALATDVDVTGALGKRPTSLTTLPAKEQLAFFCGRDLLAEVVLSGGHRVSFSGVDAAWTCLLGVGNRVQGPFPRSPNATRG